MAEATYFRNNALPYPVYGVPWTVVFPILDADGDPVTGATCDSEISKNGDTGADCTNEGTEITFTTATNKGQYYLTLTAAEMTADIVTVNIYPDSGKATVIVLYPRKLVTLASGTSQGGAVGYITLAASTVDFDGQFNGCLCVATIDSNVEVRVLQACTTADQQCTVTPNWNVAPDADDTYVIYLPEGMQIPQAHVKAWNDAATAIVIDTQLANTHEVTAARMGALTDLIDDGRLDLLIDAILADVTGIDGDAMRGTNSANTTVPDAAGIAAALHATTDALIAAVAALEPHGTPMRGTEGANTTVPDAAGTAASLHSTTNAAVAAVQAVVDAIEAVTTLLPNAGALSSLALEATLTAIKGSGWSTETLKVIKAAIDAIAAGGDATAAKQDEILEDIVDIKGTGFVKDENSLVNVTGEAAVNLTISDHNLTIEDA